MVLLADAVTSGPTGDKPAPLTLPAHNGVRVGRGEPRPLDVQQARTSTQLAPAERSVSRPPPIAKALSSKALPRGLQKKPRVVHADSSFVREHQLMKERLKELTVRHDSRQQKRCVINPETSRLSLIHI